MKYSMKLLLPLLLCLNACSVPNARTVEVNNTEKITRADGLSENITPLPTASQPVKEPPSESLPVSPGLTEMNPLPVSTGELQTPQSSLPSLPPGGGSTTGTTVKVLRVEIDKSALTIEEGKNTELNASVIFSSGDISSAIDWISSDPDIAAVNDNGRVNGLKGGMAVIKAVARDNPSFFAECTVTVTSIPATPTLVEIVNTAQLSSLRVNENTQFQAVVKYSDGTSDSVVNWSVSDTSLATIDSNGNISAKNRGEVIISAVSKKDTSVKAALNLLIIDDPGVERGGIITYIGSEVRGYFSNTDNLEAVKINFPVGLAVDSKGSIYFTDAQNHLVRKIDKNNFVSDVAGLGTADPGFSGDGVSAKTSDINFPLAVATDKSDNLYIADTSNFRVRKVDALTGIITTFAGDGLKDNVNNIEGKAAAETSIRYPTGLASDNNYLYIVDSVDHKIKRVDLQTGKIYNFAGDGFNFLGRGRYKGDGANAMNASFDEPFGVALDSKGNVYVTDRSDHRVRKIDILTRVITTYAGNGIPGFAGDNGPAVNARLNAPVYLSFDKFDNLYISEFSGHRIRKVSRDGIITTIAGNGSESYSGDGGMAINSGVHTPSGLAFDLNGNLLFSDTYNNRIRKIFF